MALGRKHAAVLLGVAAVLAAALVGLAPAPASAGSPNLGGLDVTPAVSNVGTDVTVTPLAPCPQGSTQALITYANPDGTVVDSRSLALDAELGWIDTVDADAGQYTVAVICQGPNNQINAGHLAATGVQLITTGTYDDGSFQVNGIVTATPDPATSGGTTTLSVAADSACQPAGTFPVGTVQLDGTGPNGQHLFVLPRGAVDNGIVHADGTFTVVVSLNYHDFSMHVTHETPIEAGTWTISGSCERSATPSTANLGIAQAQPVNDSFTYSGTIEVVAQPTAATTTTVPPAVVAADAVTANPTFTG